MLAAAVCLGIYALPTGAHAAVSCTFNGGAVDVAVTTGTEFASVQTNAGDIEVLDDETEVTPCTGGQPTVIDTESIEVTDASGTQHSTDFTFDIENGPFEPGVGAEAGVAEIEISVEGGDNDADGDELTVVGTTGPEDWRLGALSSGGPIGVNLNAPEGGGADADADDISAAGIESVQAFADPVLGSSGDDDRLLATGGPGLAEPLAQDMQASGGNGNDTIVTGTGRGFLFGDGGDDSLTGGPLDDYLRVSFGDDVAVAGAGNDTCSYINTGTDIHVDLRITAQQAIGGGELDTLSGCENLEGGDADDTLIGTAGPNQLFGGENTAGEVGADTIFALGGTDTVDGSDGADAIQIRDGGPDTAVCGDPTPGPPPDTVTADRQGVDTINADCEQVNFLTVPPPAPPPPTAEDTTAPDTTIDNAPKRKTKKRKARFEFGSSEAGSTFECALDKKPFTSCASPFAKKVKRRRHRFQVRSTDQAGNTDPTPALHKWRVKKKRE